MQAESPGHLGVLLGGAGTLVHWGAQVASSMRVSCPEGGPRSFLGLQGAWEWILQASHLEKGHGVWEKQPARGCPHPLTKPWDSEGTQADLVLGQQRHGKCDPSQKGNERKGENKQKKKQASAPVQSVGRVPVQLCD